MTVDYLVTDATPCRAAEINALASRSLGLSVEPSSSQYRTTCDPQISCDSPGQTFVGLDCAWIASPALLLCRYLSYCAQMFHCCEEERITRLVLLDKQPDFIGLRLALSFTVSLGQNYWSVMGVA